MTKAGSIIAQITNEIRGRSCFTEYAFCQSQITEAEFMRIVAHFKGTGNAVKHMADDDQYYIRVTAP